MASVFLARPTSFRVGVGEAGLVDQRLEIRGPHWACVSLWQEQVHQSSILHTDKAKAYGTFGWMFAGHETVNHSDGVYARLDGKVSTNQVENFFSQLKRSLDGTHHHVSREHVARYLAEFDLRYSTRKLTDAERMVELVGRVGGHRLTYRPASGVSRGLVAA